MAIKISKTKLFSTTPYITRNTGYSQLISMIKSPNESTPANEINHTGKAQDKATKKITKMETKIAGLIMKGYSNKEIADRLLIKEKTVKCHLGHIFKKLGFKRRYQLMVHDRRLH